MTVPIPEQTPSDSEQMRDLAEDLSYVNFTSNDEAVSDAVITLRAAADEVDRLRAVIENAPHHWKCRWDGVNVNDVCTCWKADAL